MTGNTCLQHTEYVLWVQLRPNANVWNWWWQRHKLRNSPTFTHLPVHHLAVCRHACVCMCAREHVRVLLSFIEQVVWPCQSRGYSPASHKGSGAQTLYYGLIHHLWDSLAALKCTGPSLFSLTLVSSSPHTSMVVAPLTLCLIQFLISTPPSCLPSSLSNAPVVRNLYSDAFWWWKKIP